MTQADWSFVRRPVWLIGHVLVLLSVVGFLAASSWQLDRHEARRARDAELETRLAEPTVSLASIVGADPAAIRFRRVTVSGTFDPADEVILALQTFEGVPGHRVLTPLVAALPGFDAVLVDRGWVPLEFDQPGDSAFAPPDGVVTVTGFVRTTQVEGRNVPDSGILTQIGRVDVERLDRQMAPRLAPVFLHLAEPIAGAAELPMVVPLPDEGPAPPHLSYAVQWAVFALIAVVGYAILLRRTSRGSNDRDDPEESSPAA